MDRLSNLFCFPLRRTRPDTSIAEDLQEKEKAVADVQAAPLLRKHLVPVTSYKSGFTTNSNVLTSSERIAQPTPTTPEVDETEETVETQAAPALKLIALSDSALGVHRAQSNLPRPLVKPPSPVGPTNNALPAPKSAYQATYPKGSINPTATIPGGFGFYLSGEQSFTSKLKGSAPKEVVMSYRLMLEKGFQFQKGGKLPGIFGGDGDLSYGCSGGRKEGRCQCFSIRVMWRANGQGELYTYLPPTDANDAILAKIPPQSIRNTDYGYSIGRGAFNFNNAVGKWMTFALRVRLNTPGKKDGELELWVDGKSVIKAGGLVLRGNGGEPNVGDGCGWNKGEASRIKGLQFQTFFGGSSKEWASPKKQRAWFADVTGVIVQ